MKDKKMLERWRNRPSTSNGRNGRRNSNSDYFQDDSEFSFHNNGQKQESQKGRKYNARTCIRAVTGLEMRKTELPSESHYLAGGPPAVKSKFSDKDKGNRPKPRNRDKPSGPLQKARAEQGHGSTSVRDSTRHIGIKVTNLEEASPSPMAQFLSAGLDAGRTVLDVGKTVYNNAYNTLTQMNSKRSSEQPQPLSNKRQKRTSGQDSLVALTSAPTDSIGRRKRSRPEAKSAPIPKNQVIDLVDSDEDTEEDNVTRPLFTDVEKAKAAVAESSPQKKQQESEQKRSHNLFTDVWRDRAEQKAKQKQVGVFDMIHEVAREVKTPPDEEKISTTTYGLRQDLSDTEDSGLKTQESESNSDIDKTLQPQHQPMRSEMETFEANDGNQTQENDDNARCSKEPQHRPSREHKRPHGNSAGETSEEEANGGNQTEGDSEDDDQDFSLFPQGPARKSKSTAILQRPFEALKNRINPGLDYQQHCKVSRSDAERREPEHQTSIILEDDDSENDGATANITNDLFPHGTPKPLLRHPGGPEKDPGMKFHINTENSKMPATSPLPPDLLAPDPGNVDDMMEGFDLKSNQWKNGAKPSASRKHGRGADDEEDFWGDVTNTERKNKSKNGSSYSPDDAKASVAARKLAETDKHPLVDSDDEVSSSRTDTTDWNNPIRTLTRQTKLLQAGITKESSSSGGFSLTKRNSHQRNDLPKRKKGTRVVPGESTSGIFKTHGTRSSTKSDFDLAKKWQEDVHRRAFSQGSSRTRSSAENSDYELNKGLQEQLLADSRDRMTGRIPRKKKKPETTSDDPIVLSSDSEEENQVDDRDQEYDLFRVALGKKVFHNRCRLTFSRRRNEISLEFPQAERTTRNSNSNAVTVQFKLNQDTLRIFRFYQNKRVTKSDLSDSDDDEHVETSADFSFVAIQVTPHVSNNLDLFPNVYKGDAADAPDNTRYIVLEFEQDQDFHYFRTQMESHLQPILPPGDLKREQSYKYAGVLIKHSRKATNIQKAKQIQSAFLNGRSEEDTLLVFPFAGDPAQIDGAADGLHEPSGKLKTNRGDISEGLDEEPEEQESKKPPSPSTSSADATNSKEGEPEEEESKKPPSLSTSSTDAADSKEGVVPKVKVRQHYVTLCVKDYQRLQPEEWLNDSLVDFWMQWISRKEDKSNTNLHFFTSHFYSKLSKNGPKAVTSWTAKKHINIFEKKFIFIPINKDLHWSQCVVVNPGKIKNAYESVVEEKAKLDVPCLIFMDSLKMHKKEKIRKQIENWLNSEWKRLHPDDRVDEPFSKGKFQLFSPKVPMQNNTWDCGVFVCRYALAIFLLRNRSFTYGEVHNYNSPFSKLVTGGAEFDFDMDDIVRFRGEFQTLIERLSGVYEQWKRNPHPKIDGEKTTYKQDANPKTHGGDNETSDEQGMDAEASRKTSDEQEGSAELQGGNSETSGEQGMDGEAAKETSDDKEDNRKTQGAENATGDEQVMNGKAKKDDEETGISSDDSGPVDENGYVDV